MACDLVDHWATNIQLKPVQSGQSSFITTPRLEKTIIINWWKAVGIFDAIKMSITEIHSFGPFQEMSSFLVSTTYMTVAYNIEVSNDLIECFVNGR